MIENKTSKSRRIRSALAAAVAAPLVFAWAMPVGASADVTADPELNTLDVTYGSTPVTEGGRKIDATLDGDKLTGTVTLTDEAPIGGFKVTISENYTDGGNTLSPPAFVTVPEGQKAVSFPLTVHADHASYRILEAKAGSFSIGDPLVIGPRWKLSAYGRTGGEPGSVPIPGNFNNVVPVSIGTNLTPFGATIALQSDTHGVNVAPQLKLSPRMSGGSYEVSVDSGVPIGTVAYITATWLGQTATTRFQVTG
jgi:hypothetical protein